MALTKVAFSADFFEKPTKLLAEDSCSTMQAGALRKKSPRAIKSRKKASDGYALLFVEWFRFR